MGLKFETAFFAIVFFYFTSHEALSCATQLFMAKSSINEAMGRSYTYAIPGGRSSPTEGCKHVLLKPRLNFNIPDCFRELAKLRKVPLHPDHGKEVDQVITERGYNLVKYENVTSQDGYVQTLLRISGSPVSPPRKGKPAVMLYHGVACGPNGWFLMGEKSLPFKLANAGFEVWIVSARGTPFSERHVRLDPNKDFLQYWNFSYHELAVYDIPVYIDTILAETGLEKIFYIGYSLGGLIYPTALAERPDLNNKIHAAFLVGATVFISHSTSVAKMGTFLVDLPPPLQNLLNVMWRGRFLNTSPLQAYARGTYCTSSAMMCGMCQFSMNAFTGSSINHTIMSNLMFRDTAALSVKLWLHVGQNYRSCRFQKFDYGPETNLKAYGQTIPPAYNLLNVRAPLYIYYGEADDFVPVQDLETFRDALPPGTVKGFRRIERKNFTHFDLVSLEDSDFLVYDRFINDMKQYI